MARRSLAPCPAVPVAQLTILLNIAAAVKVAGLGDPPSRRAGLAGAGPPPLKQTRLPPLPHTAPQIFKNPFDDFSGGKTFCKAATRHTPPSTSGGFYLHGAASWRRRGRARLCMRRARGSRKAAAPAHISGVVVQARSAFGRGERVLGPLYGRPVGCYRCCCYCWYVFQGQ